MGSHNVHAKKEGKKPKQAGSGTSGQSFSSKPVFVMPQVIKKDKKEE